MTAKASRPYIIPPPPRGPYSIDFTLYSHWISSLFLAPRKSLTCFQVLLCVLKIPHHHQDHPFLVVFLYIRNKNGASCTGSDHHLKLKLSILDLSLPFYCVLVQQLSNFLWTLSTGRNRFYTWFNIWCTDILFLYTYPNWHRFHKTILTFLVGNRIIPMVLFDILHKTKFLSLKITPWDSFL